jgi:predicted TIM-barrel fold metal-dependent hydrolase
VPFAVLSAEAIDHNARETERTLAAGFAGLGELAVYHGGWTAGDFDALEPVLVLAEKHKVPVMIHVNEPVGHDYPGKIAVDFGALVRMIAAHPNQDFILAHLGGGVFVYGLMPEVAGIFGRTYLDMAASPFLYDPRVYDIAGRILGQEKILFGSDFPLLPLSRYLKELDRAGVDEDVRRGILGENTWRLLQKKTSA